MFRSVLKVTHNGFGLGEVVCRLCAVGKLRIGAVMLSLRLI
jgi:hypothetical protein